MRVFAVLGAFALSGCVGESYYYHYGVMDAYPNASGRIANVSASDTDVYADGSGNGYVLAYVKGGDAFALGVSGAWPEDRAFIGMAGFLPTTSLGVTPSSGSATLQGEYNVIWVDMNSDDPEAWPERNRNGTIEIEFLFDPSSNTFYGVSDDGRLELAGFFDSEYDFNAHTLYSTYDGLNGSGAIYVDSDQAIGVFGGHGSDDFYVGGVLVD